MKPSKYRNRKVTRDGVTWDSRKELARWRVLFARFEAGRITDLRRQVRFKLVVNGVLVAVYVADFAYREDGRLVVEDVKSPATRKLRDYRMKVKLMRACHGIEIREV